MIWIIFITYVISSSLGMILLKYGGKENSFHISNRVLSFKFDLYFILGIGLFVLSFILWVVILQKFKITFISPVAYGLTFVMLSVFSYLILNEKVTVYNVVGALLIIIGIFVSYLSSDVVQ